MYLGKMVHMRLIYVTIGVIKALLRNKKLFKSIDFDLVKQVLVSPTTNPCTG